ncbi:chaperone NapD [Ramlibacter sp. USB13]|uniref:Chaperone NapD n=1 Tax=Ramlibacter cellulosilyticus TaxID=2764187 RepID=A0A923MUR2_9BURK|nr:chaperone NapD [Ramlibacter cellulosilyticus]MBC5784117.1 chaperone NapD [Ramlibacter cellulosilyticus]
MNGAEIHVAGVLVHARPESLHDVCVAVSLLPNAEVTHEAADGRVVAVLEAATSRAVMQQLDAIRSVRGVLNVAVVYQHAEPEEAMNEEIPE